MNRSSVGSRIGHYDDFSSFDPDYYFAQSDDNDRPPTSLSGSKQPPPAPPQSGPHTGRASKGRSLRRGLGLDFTKVDRVQEDEEIGLSLLAASAPLGELSRVDVHASSSTDVATPAHPDDDLARALQHDEASGKLTGGLGRGLQPDATIQYDDLLCQPDQDRIQPDYLHSPAFHWWLALRKTISRTLAGRRFKPKPNPHVDRTAIVCRRAQAEADRRGEIIEVLIIAEDEKDTGTGDYRLHRASDPTGGALLKSPDKLWRESWGADIDLGLISSPLTQSRDDQSDRRVTMCSSITPLYKPAQIRRVFYPRPNWRPFSMRTPYLTCIVLLSVVLAVGQEVLFRHFAGRPFVQFQKPSDLSPTLYFALKFAPTMVAAVYGVVWQATNFEVKRLEAYYQLSREGGAVAARSINVDYITGLDVLRPFRALQLGHYAVALSSTATFLSESLVPTCAAAFLILTPNHAQRISHPDQPKIVYVDGIWSHLLSSTLFLCAAAACALMWMLGTRRSGLVGDVRGVAGVASMAVACHILTDFRGMDRLSLDGIHCRLRHRRYVLHCSSLAPYDDLDGGGGGDGYAGQRAESKTEKGEEKEPEGDETVRAENPHSLIMRPLGAIPFLAALVFFFALIPAFLFSPIRVLTDQAPCLVTVVAVCIKMAWDSMATAVRLMEPFYILSRRHAPPSTLTLDYTSLPVGYLAVRAFLNGHLLVGAVGVGTVMTDVLTVLTTGLATVQGLDFVGVAVGGGSTAAQNEVQSGEMTIGTFLVTLLLALFILGYMLVVAVVVYVRRRHPFLPRQPSTIASVLGFVHQSRMLYDFVDTARLSSQAVGRHLAAVGRTYGLGWYCGRDGLMHCGIDQEELMDGYRQGVDLSNGNMPWNAQWAWL